MDYLYLIAGIILLTISGNYLVKAAVGIARFFKLSALVIGATVVSMGTSAPELIVSLDAALMGVSDISLGNVIGSNIANLALVLGLTALILPIPILRSGIRFDWTFMMFASALLWIVLARNGGIGFYEGLVFVILLVVYIIWSIQRGKTSSAQKESVLDEAVVGCPNSLKGLLSMLKSDSPLPLPLSIVLLVVSIAGLKYGAEFLVSGASNIARELGISERIIGLTVVAVGTSLPELATSLMAAIKKQMDISVGNLIGSNIFNILGILGVTALVTPIPLADPKIINDLIWMTAISGFLLFLLVPVAKKFDLVGFLGNFKTFLFSSKSAQNGIVNRWEGFIYLMIYILYVLLVFI